MSFSARSFLSRLVIQSGYPTPSKDAAYMNLLPLLQLYKRHHQTMILFRLSFMAFCALALFSFFITQLWTVIGTFFALSLVIACALFTEKLSQRIMRTKAELRTQLPARNTNIDIDQPLDKHPTIRPYLSWVSLPPQYFVWWSFLRVLSYLSGGIVVLSALGFLIFSITRETQALVFLRDLPTTTSTLGGWFAFWSILTCAAGIVGAWLPWLLRAPHEDYHLHTVAEINREIIQIPLYTHTQTPTRTNRTNRTNHTNRADDAGHASHVSHVSHAGMMGLPVSALILQIPVWAWGTGGSFWARKTQFARRWFYILSRRR